MESTSSITASIQWVLSVLLGSLGGAIAVIAVAVLGFGMLQGRVPLRGGLRALFGMFVLFLAPAIAQDLLRSARGADQQPEAAIAAPRVNVPQEMPAFDPYAGAAAPTAQ